VNHYTSSTTLDAELGRLN